MKVAAGVIFIFLVIVVLPFSLLDAQKTNTGLAQGTWSGRANGADVKSYSVTVTLDGTGVGFVEYSSLKCGGKLRFVRRTGNTFSYRETITHGKTKCGAAGQVDMVPNGDQLFWSPAAGGQKVTATLTMVDNPGPHACSSCELNYDQNAAACYRIANAID
jgi:hypothetical protein